MLPPHLGGQFVALVGRARADGLIVARIRRRNGAIKGTRLLRGRLVCNINGRKLQTVAQDFLSNGLLPIFREGAATCLLVKFGGHRFLL